MAAGSSCSDGGCERLLGHPGVGGTIELPGWVTGAGSSQKYAVILARPVHRVWGLGILGGLFSRGVLINANFLKATDSWIFGVYPAQCLF